eukprot:scaffold1475_cov147-Isochrysis_galbana.AAC.2
MLNCQFAGAFGFGVIPVGGSVKGSNAPPFQGWSVFFVELLGLALCMGRLISLAAAVADFLWA